MKRVVEQNHQEDTINSKEEFLNNVRNSFLLIFKT